MFFVIALLCTCGLPFPLRRSLASRNTSATAEHWPRSHRGSRNAVSVAIYIHGKYSCKKVNKGNIVVKRESCSQLLWPCPNLGSWWELLWPSKLQCEGPLHPPLQLEPHSCKKWATIRNTLFPGYEHYSGVMSGIRRQWGVRWWGGGGGGGRGGWGWSGWESGWWWGGGDDDDHHRDDENDDDVHVDVGVMQPLMRSRDAK